MSLQEERLLRKDEVLYVTGIKASSTLYDMIRRGDFPAPYKLTSRTSVWKYKDVAHFIDNIGRRSRDK